MKYIIAIDDTDDIHTIGTGEHLENIIKKLEEKELCTCSRVTRHQLFFSPLVKYTSHNSSMSSILEIELIKNAQEIFEIAKTYIIENSAEKSDPGICLLRVDSLSDEQTQQLLDYGKKAKKEYVQKQEAFDMAKKVDAKLEELGGEGIGVIGAIAGVGLRLSGNDGRYKGKFSFGQNEDNMKAKDILSHPYIDVIKTEQGELIEGETEVYIVDRIKTVNLDNKSVLLVKKEDGKYTNMTRHELKSY